MKFSLSYVPHTRKTIKRTLNPPEAELQNFYFAIKSVLKKTKKVRTDPFAQVVRCTTFITKFVPSLEKKSIVMYKEILSELFLLF